eukprot:CAMPEP_0118654180 /NCGR_PEP_ID=MMETSP0785-20121206/12247_1 /TAXON_ID=91992 /ORGANISM="Bolidomonas pacifica, Strain CCMP 1866" /LENGTH=39 /DNA_ID= /DNA_START= /DNA_END= /DNA_ORIENTATION=
MKLMALGVALVVFEEDVSEEDAIEENKPLSEERYVRKGL